MKMAEILYKFDNLRTAKAKGKIYLSKETIKKILSDQIPKGDVLKAAEIAGILGGKKTADLLPFCHNIPIDYIEIKAYVGEDYIEVESEVKGIWRTGYEMEALSAVMAALLNIFDMCKSMDSNMKIGEVRIISKSGGKTDWAEDLSGLKVAIITVSDSSYKGEREDKSGKLAQDLIKKAGGEIIGYEIVPDEINKIQQAIRNFKNRGANIIITTGGTGYSYRDVTPEAVKPLLNKSAPAIAEAMHILGIKFTPKSLMSRGIAGFINPDCFIITLPGSSKGVEQNLKMLMPLFKHALNMAKGKGH